MLAAPQIVLNMLVTVMVTPLLLAQVLLPGFSGDSLLARLDAVERLAQDDLSVRVFQIALYLLVLLVLSLPVVMAVLAPRTSYYVRRTRNRQEAEELEVISGREELRRAERLVRLREQELDAEIRDRERALAREVRDAEAQLHRDVEVLARYRLGGGPGEESGAGAYLE